MLYRVYVNHELLGNKGQVKCQGLDFSDQESKPLKRRRVSTRIDDAPHTQHHFHTSKDKYRVEFYFDTLDIMVNSLGRRFDKATCSLLKGLSALQNKP